MHQQFSLEIQRKGKAKEGRQGLWVKQKSETERDNMVNDDEKKIQTKRISLKWWKERLR